MPMSPRQTATVSAQSRSLLIQISYSRTTHLIFNNYIVEVLIENQAIEQVPKYQKQIGRVYEEIYR